MSWPLLGLGLLLLAGGGAEPPQENKPVPLYTNEDLDRVAPWRDQTGVNSPPAVAARPEAPPARTAGDRRAARGEAYWRREAESMRSRLRPLRLRLEDLRARIAESEADPGPRPRPRARAGGGSRASTRGRSGRARTAQTWTGESVALWQRQAAVLERTIKEAEDRLEDRARREGALPGWLR